MFEKFDKKKKDAKDAETQAPQTEPVDQVDEEFEDVTVTADEAPEAEVEETAEPEEQADPIAEELAHQKELYQRLAAEYDNFRKRTVREKEALANDVRSECIKELLPVLDNLERALGAETDSAEAMFKGVELVQTQALAIFERMGVTAFGEVGEQFDPNLHHGVSTAKTEQYESGQITLVMQKGYMLGDKVIRPAMVQTEE